MIEFTFSAQVNWWLSIEYNEQIHAQLEQFKTNGKQIAVDSLRRIIDGKRMRMGSQLTKIMYQHLLQLDEISFPFGISKKRKLRINFKIIELNEEFFT